MLNQIAHPIEADNLLRNRKKIKQSIISGGQEFLHKKIAIMGGSTTAEFREILDLFLLNIGIKAEFYESEFGKFYEEIHFLEKRLVDFNPDIIYIFTSNFNISNYPDSSTSEDKFQDLLKREFNALESIWETIEKNFNSVVIQHNYELPFSRPFGNFDNYSPCGKTRFINELNVKISNSISQRKSIYLNDINWLSSWLGLREWSDKKLWFSYKYAFSFMAITHIAKSASAIIAAIYGLSKKCLVLDLDNTLWGGVIGDDGIEGISLGAETPDGEAYRDFQKYVLELKARGILLAICSKNDLENALLGLSHPDSLIRVEDFAAIRANWEPKSNNIKELAFELNIDISSIVFVDDNPTERELVISQEPLVSVPNIGDDISDYIKNIDQSCYFEPVSFSKEDVLRNRMYKENKERNGIAAKFDSYEEFLKSLDMRAKISHFDDMNIERIYQLINKTNQFNLTTKRLTFEQVKFLVNNANYISIYGKLSDKFGDNGLISVLSGKIDGTILDIEIWLMSCRVLKRGMEDAMLIYLIEIAKNAGLKTIRGTYIPSKKNQMVQNLYSDRGFKKTGGPSYDGSSFWELNVDEFMPANIAIEVNK